MVSAACAAAPPASTIAAPRNIVPIILLTLNLVFIIPSPFQKVLVTYSSTPAQKNKKIIGHGRKCIQIEGFREE
jgi:hypothetical protein